MRQRAALITVLRPHQWLKNLLVLGPVLAAHRFDPQSLLTALGAFISFSLCASGGYVVNDLADTDADRRHARKRDRPFASGQLTRTWGAALVAAMWIASFGVAAVFLPSRFLVVLAAYLIGTTLYSLWFKKEPVLDVIVLAGLYVVRVVAGGVAGAIFISNWLLTFTLFASLSLAFLKRFVEVREATTREAPLVPGRGYQMDDAGWLHASGLASAYLSVLVVAIYVNSADAAKLYRRPDLLLLVCPALLYWATRAWLRAHRGDMHDDPVIAVASDPATYGVVFVTAILAALAV